ncbi:MAG: DcrB-related protein [Myxococcota bacterium]
MKHVLPIGSIAIPDDWEDRTTYQFVSQPKKGLEVPMAAGRAVNVNATRTSVLLARAPIPEGSTIEEFLRNQIDELKKALPGLKVNSRDPWSHAQLGAVQTVDVTFEIGPGMPVRQLQFYFATKAPHTYATLTLSCNAKQYDQQQSEMQQIFASYVGA